MGKAVGGSRDFRSGMAGVSSSGWKRRSQNVGEYPITEARSTFELDEGSLVTEKVGSRLGERGSGNHERLAAGWPLGAQHPPSLCFHLLSHRESVSHQEVWAGAGNHELQKQGRHFPPDWIPRAVGTESTARAGRMEVYSMEIYLAAGVQLADRQKGDSEDGRAWGRTQWANC